jgi:hypothetical protein
MVIRKSIFLSFGFCRMCAKADGKIAVSDGPGAMVQSGSKQPGQYNGTLDSDRHAHCGIVRWLTISPWQEINGNCQ